VYSMVLRREKKKDSRYIQEASAPAAVQCIRAVTSCTSVTINVTIWKLGRTVCVYSMVQRREKDKDSRYIQEASAPAAVTVYQTCNIMYICNN